MFGFLVYACLLMVVVYCLLFVVLVVYDFLIALGGYWSYNSVVTCLVSCFYIFYFYLIVSLNLLVCFMFSEFWMFAIVVAVCLGV